MPRTLSKKETALLREAFESEKAEVKRRLARNWKQTVVLKEKIAAASSIGRAHEELDDKMEILRRCSMKLGEQGEALEVNLSELVVVNNSVPRTGWRPTTVEPF